MLETLRLDQPLSGWRIPPPLEKAVATAELTVDTLFDKIDQSSAAIVDRFPEYLPAIRDFLKDLRVRVYGPSPYDDPPLSPCLPRGSVPS